MTSLAVHRSQRRLIEAHFRGRGSPSGERSMFAHLTTCDACRAHYERHLLLANADPAALAARDRLARGLGLAPERRRARGLLVLAPLAALGAMALLLVLRTDAGSFRPRGGAHPGSQLLVYEVARDGSPRPARSVIAADSGLAFAYANIGRKQRLWVFAVDERRQVYWYHPAWRDPTESPGGVPLAGDDAIHEIPQVVYHPLAGGVVRLFGVFDDRPMTVRDLERAVAAAPEDAQGRLTLELPGAEVVQIALALEAQP